MANQTKEHELLVLSKRLAIFAEGYRVLEMQRIQESLTVGQPYFTFLTEKDREIIETVSNHLDTLHKEISEFYSTNTED